MDARTRQPIPGVEVAVFAKEFEPRQPGDGDVCPWEARSFARSSDAWEWNRAEGWVQITDERGEFVVVGPARGVVSVACRLVGRYVESRLWPKDAGKTRDLWLEPEVRQRFRVLDHRGEPASGLYIRATCESEGDPDGNGDPWQFDAWTDERGEAEVRHLQTIPVVGRAAARLRVTFGCLGMDPVDWVLDPAVRSVEVVEWRLPATGSVRLTVRDRDDRAVAWPFRSLLGVANTERDPELDFAALSERIAPGDYIFPFVRLGIELVVGASGEFGPLVPARFLGPTQSGEVQRKTVRVDVAEHRFRMVATDTSGTPLRSQRVRLSFRAEGKAFGYTDLTLSPETTWARTDSQGRAEWTLRVPTANMVKCALDAYVFRGGKPDRVCWNVRPSGRTLPAGAHDLGAVEMARYHPYYQGRIGLGGRSTLPGFLELVVHDVVAGERGARLGWDDSVLLHWISAREFAVHVVPENGRAREVAMIRSDPVWLQFWANGRPWGRGRMVRRGEDVRWEL